jgi:hypothetical protein
MPIKKTNVKQIFPFSMQGQHSADCLVSETMVQIFARADTTYCVEVASGASVADFLTAVQAVAGRILMPRVVGEPGEADLL